MAKKKAKKVTKTEPKATKAEAVATETVTIQVQIPNVGTADAAMLRDSVVAMCRRYAPEAVLLVNAAMRIGVARSEPVHPFQPPAK